MTGYKTKKQEPTGEQTSGRIVSPAGGAPLFEGERIKVAELLGKDVKVTAISDPLDSQFPDAEGKPKKYMQVQIEFESKPRLIMVGAQTLMSAFLAADKTKLPLLTKIDSGKSKKGRPIYILS